MLQAIDKITSFCVVHLALALLDPVIRRGVRPTGGMRGRQLLATFILLATFMLLATVILATGNITVAARLVELHCVGEGNLRRVCH